MERGGWIVMVLSVSIVLALLGYCLSKVMGLPPVEVEDIKGPLEIDTGDTEYSD